MTPEKLCLLPSDLDDSEDTRVLPTADGEPEVKPIDKSSKKAHGHAKDNVDVGKGKGNMVSYGKGSNAMREGRIRRWLQDMDKATE